MKFLTDIRLLLAGIWLGSALFFIAVAQSAFAVVPQRELAGAVVNRTLSILNYSGMAIAVILLLSSWIGRLPARNILVWTERIFLVLLAAACAVGEFVIGLMLLSVRAEMGGRPIDDIPVGDPLRIRFNELHEYSVWILMAGMAAALIAFFLIANRRSTKTAAADPLAPYNFEKEFKV